MTYDAEDLPYWNTGNSSPDTWVERTRATLTALGAHVTGEGFMAEGSRASFLLQFELEGEVYRILWPVVASRAGNTLSERRQAATGLYHWAKAQALAVSVLGARASFLPFLLLPNGRTAAQVANPTLLEKLLPPMLRPALTNGADAP